MVCCTGTEQYLQGGVQFPTGGKVRERHAPNRCDSGTDSTVWMEEDTHYASLFRALGVYSGRILYS